MQVTDDDCRGFPLIIIRHVDVTRRLSLRSVWLIYIPLFPQRHVFLEGVAYMVSADPNPEHRDVLLTKTMEPANFAVCHPPNPGASAPPPTSSGSKENWNLTCF